MIANIKALTEGSSGVKPIVKQQGQWETAAGPNGRLKGWGCPLRKANESRRAER